MQCCFTTERITRKIMIFFQKIVQIRSHCAVLVIINHNMTIWILVGNYINFPILAGLIRLYMPGVK